MLRSSPILGQGRLDPLRGPLAPGRAVRAGGQWSTMAVDAEPTARSDDLAELIAQCYRLVPADELSAARPDELAAVVR